MSVNARLRDADSTSACPIAVGPADTAEARDRKPANGLGKVGRAGDSDEEEEMRLQSAKEAASPVPSTEMPDRDRRTPTRRRASLDHADSRKSRDRRSESDAHAACQQLSKAEKRRQKRRRWEASDTVEVAKDWIYHNYDIEGKQCVDPNDDWDYDMYPII